MYLDPDLIEWLDLNRDEETSRSAYLRILIRKDMKSKARRKSFKARHAKNIAKGKTSAAYWADKVKW